MEVTKDRVQSVLTASGQFLQAPGSPSSREHPIDRVARLMEGSGAKIMFQSLSEADATELAYALSPRPSSIALAREELGDKWTARGTDRFLRKYMDNPARLRVLCNALGVKVSSAVSSSLVERVSEKVTRLALYRGDDSQSSSPLRPDSPSSSKRHLGSVEPRGRRASEASSPRKEKKNKEKEEDKEKLLSPKSDRLRPQKASRSARTSPRSGRTSPREVKKGEVDEKAKEKEKEDKDKRQRQKSKERLHRSLPGGATLSRSCSSSEDEVVVEVEQVPSVSVRHSDSSASTDTTDSRKKSQSSSDGHQHRR